MTHKWVSWRALWQLIYLRANGSTFDLEVDYIAESWGTELWFVVTKPFRYKIADLVFDEANKDAAWEEVDVVVRGGPERNHYFSRLQALNAHWQEGAATERLQWTENLLDAEPEKFCITVTATRGGNLKVINGYHRLRIAVLCGSTEIGVVVSTGDRIASSQAIPRRWETAKKRFDCARKKWDLRAINRQIPCTHGAGRAGGSTQK